MGFFKGAAKWFFLPVLKTSKDVSTSIKNTRDNIAQVKARRLENIETAKAASLYLEGMTRREKFDHIVDLNKWTPTELERQKIAVKRARLALLCFGVFGVIMIFGASFVARFNSFIPNLILLIASILVSSMLIAACAAMALRYSWWEYSLVEKEILPFREYLSKGQFIKRLFY